MLAPYACKAEASRGRQYNETAHVYRNAFQRDRDRIIHSAAFRRLEFKTQVFGYGESDYVRNRLTHTLEVSQISRSLARSLNLNEDLTEAIALSHDLGHPPFGHAGERALNECAQAIGGFNHNIQGLRIVDQLEERYADFPGLNLSYEVREAFAKHGSGRLAMPLEFQNTGPQPVLEAQIVDLVDELTYTSHDIDDGITRQRLHFSDLAGIALWEKPFCEVKAKYPNAPLKILRHETVRRVINHLATDLLESSRARLADSGINSVDDARQYPEPLLAYSPAMAQALAESKTFLMAHLYRNHIVLQANQKAVRIVHALYQTFSDVPEQLPPRFQALAKRDGPARAAVDYIAGMTDKYAFETYARLFGAG